MSSAGCFAMALCCSVLLSASVTLSQEARPLLATASRVEDVAGAALVRPAVPRTAEEPASLTPRWLEVTALTYTDRYLNTANTRGRHLFEFGQHRYVAEGDLRLDRAGRYTVHFRGSSGRYFNWAYADLIGGQYQDSVVAARAYKTAEQKAALDAALLVDPDAAVYRHSIPTRGGYFSLRQLYGVVKPVQQVAVEYGSLGIEQGQNSDITTLDEGGYIAGGRVRVRDSEHLYFDQVAVTVGFVGDALKPNVFARGADLRQVNYQQYLVEKRLGKHWIASTDYTELRGTHTFREGLVMKIAEGRVIDTVRFEMYQRTNAVAVFGTPAPAGWGYGIMASKLLLHKRVNLGGGLDSVDSNFSVYSGSPYLVATAQAWNGSATGVGARGFARMSFKLGTGIRAEAGYAHTTAPLDLGTKQSYAAGVVFDVKALANMGRRVF